MLSKKLIDSHMRTTIESIVDDAIANKPNNCRNIRIITKDEYVGSSNPFMPLGHYTKNTYARYQTDDGEKDIKIRKGGDWIYGSPANHILQEMGEYHPFSTEDYFSNQGFYESDLDSGMIDKPIKGILSPKWELKRVCEKIIENNINNVQITLWFDEDELTVERFDSVDYRHNWDDFKLKQYYCAKITIVYNDKAYTTRGGFYSEYFSWMNKCVNALEKHNISYTADITDDDYVKWFRFYNWNDMEFEDPRFNL